MAITPSRPQTGCARGESDPGRLIIARDLLALPDAVGKLLKVQGTRPARYPMTGIGELRSLLLIRGFEVRVPCPGL